MEEEEVEAVGERGWVKALVVWEGRVRAVGEEWV